MKFSIAVAALAAAVSAAPQQLRQRSVDERAGSGHRVHRVNKANQKIESATLSHGGSNNARGGYSSNWAGAVKRSTGITRVAGTITVPKVGSDGGHSGAAWVGIDGDSDCGRALLQTGIDFFNDGTFDAWWEWIPDNVNFFDNFTIAEGDQIFMEVDASSTTTGVATLENLTNGDKVTHDFEKGDTPSTLCETDADWIIEDYEDSFADFGSITFTDNSATGADGDFTPSGANIYNLSKDDGKTVLTDCSVSGSDVTCSYSG